MPFVGAAEFPWDTGSERRLARWTCVRRLPAKGGRGRGGRRAALYDAMSAYAEHFRPLLEAERAAEQAAFLAAARAPPPIAGVRASRRPRVLGNAVFELKPPGRGERLPDECRIAKGDVAFVREDRNGGRLGNGRVAGTDLRPEDEGFVEASVLERTPWSLLITVPIGSDASRILDGFDANGSSIAVFQGANATANERAVAALSAVTDKREDRSGIAVTIVRSLSDENVTTLPVANGPTEQAVSTSRGVTSAWEEASRAAPPGLDKPASATAVQQVVTRMKPSPNKSQRNAIKTALTRSLSIVQGPPGTGKTITAAGIIVSAVISGRTPILATASSNIAVDNLLEKFLQVCSAVRKVRVVRVGRVAAVQEALWDYTLEGMLEKDPQVKRAREAVEKESSDANSARDVEEKAARRIVRSADVVMTTCVGAGRDVLENVKFQFVLCDEASQATEPDALIPLTIGDGPSLSQVVLVGDHHQLPPTVLSDDVRQDGLSRSLFSRMWASGVTSVMLDMQYRMHPHIASFPSEHFYFRKLETGVARKDRPLPEGDADGGAVLVSQLRRYRVVFVDVSEGEEERDVSQDLDAGFSFFNREEVKVVAQVVRDMPFAVDEVGVISPYAAQVRLLFRALSRRYGGKIEISTVDGFQGREKTVIVFSAVRCNKEGRVGFLADWRRLNVALTRAKSALVVVGSRSTLCNDKHWAAWLETVPVHRRLNINLDGNGNAPS